MMNLVTYPSSARQSQEEPAKMTAQARRCPTYGTLRRPNKADPRPSSFPSTTVEHGRLDDETRREDSGEEFGRRQVIDEDRTRVSVDDIPGLAPERQQHGAGIRP